MVDSKPTSGSSAPPRCPSERVGRFEMAIVSAELSPEAAEHRARRAEVLAGWLAAVWEKDRQGAGHE